MLLMLYGRDLVDIGDHLQLCLTTCQYVFLYVCHKVRIFQLKDLLILRSLIDLIGSCFAIN